MSVNWKISESYAELKSLLHLARVRTAIRFMDVQRLRTPGDLRILNSLMRQEVGLLLMHFGYCSMQGFAIPRPSWLMQWSEHLFSAIDYEAPGTTLFATLDREEDKAADDSILEAGPSVGFWWSTTTLVKGMVISEQDVRIHFQKWLTNVQATESLYEADDNGTKLLVLPEIWWARDPGLTYGDTDNPSQLNAPQNHNDVLVVPVPGPTIHPPSADKDVLPGNSTSPNPPLPLTCNSHLSIATAVDTAWKAAVDAHAAIDAVMASNREAVEASAYNIQVLTLLINLVQWSEGGNPFPDGHNIAPSLSGWVHRIAATAHPKVQEEFQRLRDSSIPYLSSTHGDVDKAVFDDIMAVSTGSQMESYPPTTSGLPNKSHLPATSGLPNESHPLAASRLPSESHPPATSGLPNESDPPATSGLHNDSQPPAASGLPNKSHPPATSGLPNESHPLGASRLPSESHPPAASGLPNESDPPATSGLHNDSQPPAASGLPNKSHPPATSGLPNESHPLGASGLPNKSHPPAASGSPKESNPPASTRPNIPGPLPTPSRYNMSPSIRPEIGSENEAPLLDPGPRSTLHYPETDNGLEYTSVGDLQVGDDSSSDSDQIQALILREYPPTSDDSDNDDIHSIVGNISDYDSGYVNDNQDDSSQSDA